MCTVTLIPKGTDDFVLTSNRDEAPDRTTLSPDFYTIDKTKLLFPKDEVAVGSWIGVSEKQRLLCVLNGGFVRHERKSNYRLSRGIVMKDLLVAANLDEAINVYDLDGVEPFTLVIVDWEGSMKFKEFVWDGVDKHVKNLPIEPTIWSSSSLYNASMKNERLDWFANFKTENEFSSNAIMKFHTTAGTGNDDYGVIMDRVFVKTTSITQVIKNQNEVLMSFKNLQSNSESEHKFQFPISIND